MNGHTVIAQAVIDHVGIDTQPDDDARAILDALREACGGGEVVIRADGTLWRTVRDDEDLPRSYWMRPMVPVERGA